MASFISIGIIMLMIVFMFYLRMIEARMSIRKKESDLKPVLEKIKIFQQAGDDHSALKLADEAVMIEPNNDELKSLIKKIQSDLNKREVTKNDELK